MLEREEADDLVFADARNALIDCYSAALSRGARSPLDALESMAAALGALYREVALEHSSLAGCPCGWKPNGLLDVLVLQRMLAAHCGADPEDELFGLVTATPMGHG